MLLCSSTFLSPHYTLLQKCKVKNFSSLSFPLTHGPKLTWRCDEGGRRSHLSACVFWQNPESRLNCCGTSSRALAYTFHVEWKTKEVLQVLSRCLLGTKILAERWKKKKKKRAWSWNAPCCRLYSLNEKRNPLKPKGNAKQSAAAVEAFKNTNSKLLTAASWDVAKWRVTPLLENVWGSKAILDH